MIWIVLLAAVLVGAYWFIFREEDAPITLKAMTEKAKDVADVNNDGKVDMKDAMAAVAEVQKEVKKVKKKYGGKVKKTK
jgi:F0F1-type ATP synthase membrane subunit b/b'